ncbi:MAG: serine hydrolase [Chitinophagaceae bacterium]|nr:serine hydrolase [Chitinophagaceae bacterium]
MRKIAVILAGFLFSFSSFSQAPSFITSQIDDYINQGLKDWNIPGLAIAIVKDGRVVMMKGYGVRDVKSQAPVDENTLFMIASNSKLFTGTALSQLDYYKKLSLDDKVSKYMPGYRVYDSAVSKLITIRDLLSHRLGTKTFQGDFTFWNASLSRGEIIEKMRLLKPVNQFRQNFGYCNSCFLTAGEIIPIVTGKPWEVYIYDSIVMPLGMTNTHTLGYGMSQMPNASKPYTTQFTGELNELPYDLVDNLAPAGSILSCVKDLSKWLMMQLDSGRYEGKRIFPWSVIQRTRDMNTVISSRKSGSQPVHFTGYGLGVFESDYNGRQIFYHTGGADGFVTNTCFVPEEKLGITILTNNDNQNFFEILRYQILNAYLGMPYINLSQQQLPGFKNELQQTATNTKNMQARVKGNNPPLSATAYTGEYWNDLYGRLIITKQQGNDLKIDFKGHNNLTATLQYMDNSEWLITFSNIAFGIFPLKFKTDGNKVSSVDIKVNDFLEYDPYTFIKRNK